jgi:hypothetical protein
MDATTLINLRTASIVFFVINTGGAGIGKYQYLGVFKEHNDNKYVHLFLSEYFLSTVTIEVGKESDSRRLKNLFLTEQEAKDHKAMLIKNEKETYE